MPEYIEYTVGMLVKFPAQYGEEVLRVYSVRGIFNSQEQKLMKHNQFIKLQRQNGEIDHNSISGYHLVPVEVNTNTQYIAVVSTGEYRVTSGDVEKYLPEGYSIHDSEVEAIKNSVRAAHISVLSGGRIVFYPVPFDNTGTVKEFIRAFEEKNPECKFKDQSDA